MFGFGGNMLGFVFIFLVIMVIIFLICREIVCWYFKINSIVALLTEIRDLLAKGQSTIGSTSIAPMSGDGQGPVPNFSTDSDIITLSKEMYLKENPGDWARTKSVLGNGIKLKIIKRNPDGWAEVTVLNGSDPYTKEGWIKIS